MTLPFDSANRCDHSAFNREAFPLGEEAIRRFIGCAIRRRRIIFD
jgi:hypothetical protein